jgi:uncharacterized protein with von Willebrand factor type A (vWA) domain
VVEERGRASESRGLKEREEGGAPEPQVGRIERKAAADARLQKRDLAVIHFSGPDDLRVDLFPKGASTPAEVIACASFFFNGGTAFEPRMKKALELVDESVFEKDDVICVSDGVSDVSPEAQTEWTKRRAERGMRAYGVLLGSNQGEALLSEISDAVFRLDDLCGDLPALEVIFSAV